MGGGGMLLDDEGAGADAADRELLVLFDLRRLGRNVLDLRPRRPLAQEGEQPIDRLLGPLGVDAHRPVLLIPHPAQDPELARPSHRRFAEADALDRARDDSAHRLLAAGRPLSHRAAPPAPPPRARPEPRCDLVAAGGNLGSHSQPSLEFLR